MKEEEIIKKITVDLLKNLLVQGEVRVQKDSQTSVFMIQINSKDSGYLIGYHGETLRAFQLVLSLMVAKRLGAWKKIYVNVGDYLQKRKEELEKIALKVAQKVKFSGEAQIVPNLSASERRIIHLALANHPDVFTESEGEGDERKLVIRPKRNK